jgi:hypothetical protein
MANKNTLKFETSDFYLSAFLLTQNFRLLNIKKIDPRRFLFIFEDKKDRQNLIEDFLFGRTKIEPKSFIGAIKELKQLLHSNL